MENLNNSFPNYNHHEGIYFNIGSETYDEKINSSFFKISNLKFCDKQENKENFNSSIRKKNSLDISYSIEQTFYENSNINIDDEFQNEETFLRIGNEGQKNSIDPIQEVDWFDKENNESFFHENNYFFNNFNDNNNSIDFQINSSTGIPSDLFKFDSLQEKEKEKEESEISQIRKNILSLKQNKGQSANKSDIVNVNSNNTLRRQIFNVSNNPNVNNQLNHINSNNITNRNNYNISNSNNNNINNFQSHFNYNYPHSNNINNNNNNNYNNNFNYFNNSNNATLNNISSNWNNNNNSGCFNTNYHSHNNYNNTFNQNWNNTNTNNNINNNNNNTNQIVINLPLFNNIASSNNNINSNNINSSNRHSTNNIKELNHSCNNISLSNSFTKRRGRKKFLLEGFKTEIIDKAYLREFRIYLKKSKAFRIMYDESKSEEKLFWNEFLQNSNPPFVFNINNQKVEFKSFNKNLLKYIFSFNSSQTLYNIFIKEKGKELIQTILSKKIKQLDKKMILLYNFYGKNLHKLYSDDYNINDLLFEEFENQNYKNIQNSINSICLGDLMIINNVNTSI